MNDADVHFSKHFSLAPLCTATHLCIMIDSFTKTSLIVAIYNGWPLCGRLETPAKAIVCDCSTSTEPTCVFYTAARLTGPEIQFFERPPLGGVIKSWNKASTFKPSSSTIDGFQTVSSLQLTVACFLALVCSQFLIKQRLRIVVLMFLYIYSHHLQNF